MNLNTNVLVQKTKFIVVINNQFIKISKNILHVIIPNKIKINLSKAFIDIDLAILAPTGILNNKTTVHNTLIKTISKPINL